MRISIIGSGNVGSVIARAAKRPASELTVAAVARRLL
jgi:hypothetical protein